MLTNNVVYAPNLTDFGYIRLQPWESESFDAILRLLSERLRTVLPFVVDTAELRKLRINGDITYELTVNFYAIALRKQGPYRIKIVHPFNIMPQVTHNTIVNCMIEEDSSKIFEFVRRKKTEESVKQIDEQTIMGYEEY